MRVTGRLFLPALQVRILLALLYLAFSSAEAPSAARQIAIIGAGAGGSSAAYHIKRWAAEANVAVNISIFEKTDRIGGRTLTIDVYDNPLERVEVGASIFIPENEILWNAAREFSLPLTDASADEDGPLGIWDGERFVHIQGTGSTWWEYAKLFWKYGLAPYRTKKLVDQTVQTFLQLYRAPNFPFRSLTSRAFELGLVRATADTGSQFLSKNGISQEFAHDIVQACTRVNYASNLQYIHGLDTMVSMAPDGAVSVLGGNWQIFDGMVKASQAKVFLNHSVTRISVHSKGANGSPSPKYLLQTKASDPHSDSMSAKAESQFGPFDDVVLAAPFQFSDISDAEQAIKYPIDEIPYVQLHVTLFASPFTPSAGFFNLSGQTVPSVILTTLAPSDSPATGVAAAGKAGFFSISQLRLIQNPTTKRDELLYKIFSPEKVTPEFLSSLLGVKVPSTFTGTADAEDHGTEHVEPISWYHAHVFNSYPVAYPRVTFQDPIIGPNLYYTSGIESFISTMETSALMGMNIARLIVDDILEESKTSDSFKDEAQAPLGGQHDATVDGEHDTTEL